MEKIDIYQSNFFARSMMLNKCLISSSTAIALFISMSALANAAISEIDKCSLSKQLCNSLSELDLDGELSFSHLADVSRDYGDIRHSYPAAVLYPASVEDIATVIRFAYTSASNLTVAARGAGHSTNGQAQAPGGIVIEMSTLKGIRVQLPAHEVASYHHLQGEVAYVDARGGELWIDVIRATIDVGLAPRSFTDYLYLSVGGTLSNAGISGQAFRYGPQITNVLELEVVTGTGEIANCSNNRNQDLFFGILGGLGQFGIITMARIPLQRSPDKVIWIRALYSNFSTFSSDQEYLISQPLGKSFDYIEGSVVGDAASCCNDCKMPANMSGAASSSEPQSSAQTVEQVFYCLEVAKNFFEYESPNIHRTVSAMLAPLRHLPSVMDIQDTTYLSFLDRVHVTELMLRKGLWSAPHPWLNLFIPKTAMAAFDAWTFKRILRGGVNGPILVYPINKTKWDSRMSAVTPEEEIFYAVGLLGTASPSAGLTVEILQRDNALILDYCIKEKIQYKQYLPKYLSTEEWILHFGEFWPTFEERKSKFDPKAILSPGQKIFSRSQ